MLNTNWFCNGFGTPGPLKIYRTCESQGSQPRYKKTMYLCLTLPYMLLTCLQQTIKHELSTLVFTSVCHPGPLMFFLPHPYWGLPGIPLPYLSSLPFMSPLVSSTAPVCLQLDVYRNRERYTQSETTEGEKERERDTQRLEDRDWKTETDRDRQRQTDMYKDRQTESRSSVAHRQSRTHNVMRRRGQTQTDRQTGRTTDGQMDRWTDAETATGRQTDRRR